jgi:acetyl esterase/lipase
MASSPTARRLAAWALSLAAVAGATHAAPPSADVAPRTVREDVFPRSEVRFPGGVVALPDVEYANLTGYRPLTLDLYLPPRSAKSAPLVVWVHGGGWSRGDARTSGAFADYPRVLASLAARGFVVASVNYRLSGEARFPAPLQDVKAAIRHLRAGPYGVDPARVYLWGGSAGGYLAALAAVTCDAPAFAPLASTGRLSGSDAAKAQPPGGSDCVQGAAIWYGVFDLADAAPLNVERLLGCDPTACVKTAADASPITQVDRADPPMLLIHGDADAEVRHTQSLAMAEALKRAGVPVETVVLPGVDHGFIGKTPEATRAANLDALARTFAFFEAAAGLRSPRGR